MLKHNTTAAFKPFTLLSEIEPKQASALWNPRIYFGELNIIDGEPGTNKSSMVLDLAARLSAGAEMPDGGNAVKGGVILLAAENDVMTTSARGGLSIQWKSGAARQPYGKLGISAF